MELAAFALARVDAEAPAAGPVLLNRDPAPGESDVPRGATLALEITTAAGGPLDAWAVRVYVNDVVAFDGGAGAPIAPGYAAAGSAWSHTGPSLRVVLAPQAPLPSGGEVRVRVVASSGGGAARLDAAYAFTVEDVAPPRLVAAVATGAHTVRLAFDKPIATADAACFRLRPLSAPAMQGAVAAAIASDTFVDLTLAAPLSPGVLYDTRAVGVADARGHVLAPPGDTARFTAFRPPRPESRSFDLWSMLPKHNRRQDISGELQKFIACFQEVTDWLLADLDAIADATDLERTPEGMLDHILRDLGNPFDLPLTLLQKRRLASTLAAIYQQKGTAPGIKNAIRFFLGLEDLDITPLAATALVLGDSALGEEWELGPSTRFAHYAFEVRVGRILTDDERAVIRAIVEYSRPSHTHLSRIVEPSAPATFDDWELGISELGVASLLH